MTLVWRVLDECKNCGNICNNACDIDGSQFHFTFKDGKLFCYSFVPVRVATEESVMAERKELAEILANVAMSITLDGTKAESTMEADLIDALHNTKVRLFGISAALRRGLETKGE